MIRGSTALLAAGVVLLAGCSSDGPAPRSLPPLPSASAASPSPTALPSVAPPVLPVTAAAATSQAASSFGRHYMKLIQYAFATGDSAELQRLSSASCTGCQNFVAAVEASAAQGHVARDAQIVVLGAVSPAIEANATTVDLRYERLSGAVVDQAGVVLSNIPRQPVTEVQLSVLYNRGWSVQEISSVNAGR